nr:protein FAR1-RELATED SEQUENCE 3-like [Ipomoea batatas]GMD70483.1 protein FAR1-RELATED SEQUENCE 3-like [Ipomoea batatas]
MKVGRCLFAVYCHICKLVYTCLKSMTWMIERKNPTNKVAGINLKLQDYGKSPAGETEVQF